MFTNCWDLVCPLTKNQQRCEKRPYAYPDLVCMEGKPRDEGTSWGLKNPIWPIWGTSCVCPNSNLSGAPVLAHSWRTNHSRAFHVRRHFQNTGTSRTRWQLEKGFWCHHAGDGDIQPTRISYEAPHSSLFAVRFNVSSVFLTGNGNAATDVLEENLCINNFVRLYAELSEWGSFLCTLCGEDGYCWKTPRPPAPEASRTHAALCPQPVPPTWRRTTHCKTSLLSWGLRWSICSKKTVRRFRGSSRERPLMPEAGQKDLTPRWAGML